LEEFVAHLESLPYNTDPAIETLREAWRRYVRFERAQGRMGREIPCNTPIGPIRE
jgi:hypothetical protein